MHRTLDDESRGRGGYPCHPRGMRAITLPFGSRGVALRARTRSRWAWWCQRLQPDHQPATGPAVDVQGRGADGSALHRPPSSRPTCCRPCACPSSALEVEPGAVLRSLSAAGPRPAQPSRFICNFEHVADARGNVWNVVSRSWAPISLPLRRDTDRARRGRETAELHDRFHCSGSGSARPVFGAVLEVPKPSISTHRFAVEAERNRPISRSFPPIHFWHRTGSGFQGTDARECLLPAAAHSKVMLVTPLAMFQLASESVWLVTALPWMVRFLKWTPLMVPDDPDLPCRTMDRLESELTLVK